MTTVSRFRKKKQPVRQRRPILLIAGLAAVAIVVLTVGGFAFAATQEQNDPFCASCHTQPESTFFARSTASAPTDLASFHTTKNVKCIDCHSGVGLSGRLGAELMGARNAFAWFTGTAVQPAPLNYLIADENCPKCHDKIPSGVISPSTPRVFTQGPAGHYHRFLARWQAADKNAGGCTSCHNSHLTDGTLQTVWLNSTAVSEVCNACHNALGGGG